MISAAGLGSVLDAGVVEGDVEAPERVDGLSSAASTSSDAGHVAPDGERLAAGLLDHPRRFAVGVLGDVGDDDAGALARERERRRRGRCRSRHR